MIISKHGWSHKKSDQFRRGGISAARHTYACLRTLVATAVCMSNFYWFSDLAISNGTMEFERVHQYYTGAIYDCFSR